MQYRVGFSHSAKNVLISDYHKYSKKSDSKQKSITFWQRMERPIESIAYCSKFSNTYADFIPFQWVEQNLKKVAQLGIILY